MTLIDLTGIGRTVKLPTGEPLHILTGVDLAVEEGEHIAIVGRSGSGKSTLLNLLGLLDTPTAGEYRLDGEPVSRLSGSRRSHLRGMTFGFVFQQFNLLPRRTATENVCVPMLYARGQQFWRRRRLAREVLAQVGLGDRCDAMPEKLSGGEQQRVAIARALVRSPRIILADEPTGALDVDTGTTVMDLLQQVCAERGATLITITHDLAVASRAQRQFRLDHGVLTPVAAGSQVSDRGSSGGQQIVGGPAVAGGPAGTGEPSVTGERPMAETTSDGEPTVGSEPSMAGPKGPEPTADPRADELFDDPRLTGDDESLARELYEGGRW